MLRELLHGLGVDSHRDQDGGRAVAQIMETREQGHSGTKQNMHL